MTAESDEQGLVERRATRSACSPGARRPAAGARRTRRAGRGTPPSRKWGTGAAAVLAAAVATALSLGGGPARHPSAEGGAVHLVSQASRSPRRTRRSVDAVVAAEQRLTLALLDEVGDGSNVTVSPASLYLALGMLQNAARGDTADEISAALRRAAFEQRRTRAGRVTLDLVGRRRQGRHPARLGEQPVAAARVPTRPSSHACEVLPVGRLAGRLQERRRGRRDQRVDERADARQDPSSSTTSIRRRCWCSRTPSTSRPTGRPSSTRQRPGLDVHQRRRRAGLRRLHERRRRLQGAVTDDYQAVQLPYTGGRFAALAVMPTRTSLTDFIGSLTPGKLDGITAGLQNGLSASMPRFTTTSKLDLKPVLQTLGMDQAFTGSADFSGLSSQPTAVDQVIQRDYLSVGEAAPPRPR